MTGRRAVALLVALFLPMLGLAALGASPALAHQPSVGAPPTQGVLPSAVPSAMTPQVDNGGVWSVAQVGNTLVMGGTFTSISGVTHDYLAAINASTGEVLPGFNASTNGQVYSVLPGPNDHTVYVGGSFTQVNGQSRPYLTLLDTDTGAIDPSFKPPTFNFGFIRDMATSGGRLYIAGHFTKLNGQAHAGIAALNADTGAVDPFMSVQFAGHHNDTGSGAQGNVGPWAIDINSQGTRLVATGNFKTADGLPRDQLAMIDLDGPSAQVDPDWATNRYAPYCFNWAFDGYTRGVTFAPDGSYFVVNATGGGNPGTLCDATARFETASTGTDIQPTWIDQTGGDTVWGVTITDDAVFIGGHNRWNNNPLGVDRAQPGAVPRPGLAALDPDSGRPYTWNPGHNPLGAAVYALLATPSGLWMAYDANWVGNYKYKREKIAFFPYRGGYTLAGTSTGHLPGTVYLGRLGSTGQTNVLYRVDAGGPELASTDGGPDWAEDDNAQASPYRNQQSNAADWSPVPNVNSSVPSTTPSAIFDHERWSPTDSPPMTWDFPVPAGTHAEVRLYFANRYTGTSQPGQRVFNVAIDGSTVLDHYDIVADAGDQTGTMKAFSVTAPTTGDINIAFTHVTENPLVDGIEIVNKDVPPPPPPADSLSAVGFDGNTATGPTPVTGTDIPWGQTRGAFMVGDQLYYGLSDGFLHRATVNGSVFGSSERVDPYHDPVWDGVDTHDGTTFDGNSPQFYSQLPQVTGMFYSAARLYFTLNGDPNLHWAWFSPDSGIVDNTEFNTSSSVNFANADGMFTSGSTLYYVNKTDKSLYSVNFSNGAVTGSPTRVNGPSTGGVDWSNKSLFFLAGPAPNESPVASFNPNCATDGSGTCSFDATASSDPDGSIASYVWDFGDGGSSTAASPSHTFATSGSYDVKLTVTDDEGATDSVTHSLSVTVTPPSSTISFVGRDHSAPGATKSKSVTVPPSASPGDTMVLFFSSNTDAGWSGPGPGWTQVGTTFTNLTVQSQVWEREVAAGDPGSTVSMSNTSYNKGILSMVVYSGVSASTPVDAAAARGDSQTTAHTSPMVTAHSGDWVVTAWTDKSAGTSSWTVPSGITKRDDAYDTGTSGDYSLLLGDSGGPVASGDYGGFTASTDVTSAKTALWTIALSPN